MLIKSQSYSNRTENRGGDFTRGGAEAYMALTQMGVEFGFTQGGFENLVDEAFFRRSAQSGDGRGFPNGRADAGISAKGS